MIATVLMCRPGLHLRSATNMELSTILALWDLFLNNNQISDIGSLATALASNATLQVLALDNNQISDIGPLATALASANTTLQELDLTCNQISKEDKDQLSQANNCLILSCEGDDEY